MKQVQIKTTKDQKLNAYIHGLGKAKAAIIFCHGFSGDSSGIFQPQLAEKLSSKFLVCRFDFRGQGSSDGEFYNTSITRELEDLDCVVKYIKENLSTDKFILLGHSFGAAIALLYAAKNKVDGLISLSGEGDLMKAIFYEFTVKELEELDTNGETEVVNWSKDGKNDLLGRQFLDDMRKYSTVDAVKKLACPVLFVHGENDDVIPHDATKELFNLVRSPKQLILMEHTDHVYNFFTDKPKTDLLFSSIEKWLDELH